MSFRTFILGLFASFGAAWLAIIVVPFFKMRTLEPVQFTAAKDDKEGLFFPKRTGRVADGALVYAENGCYLCHTQLVRPTYAGNDMFRSDTAGLKTDEGDSRRETNAFDYFGEKYAQIGNARMGPDLSNLGLRVEKEYAPKGDPAKWLYAHLYNPRQEPDRWKSTCPSYRFLFEKRKAGSDVSPDALVTESGRELIPTSEARALVSYLLSLKKNQPVPASLNFAPPSKKKG